MGLRSWLMRRKSSGDVSSGQSGTWLSRLLGGGPTNSGLNVGPDSAMAVSTFFACCRVIAEDVAKLPVDVFTKDAKEKRSIIKNHPLHKLFISPNSWQTRFDFIEQIALSLVMWSNSYTIILRDGRGTPNMLVNVSPRQVTLYVHPETGDIFYLVSRTSTHEVAVLKDTPALIPVRDVVHIRCIYHEGLVGTSVVQYIREAVGLALASEQHGAQLFKNGARPSGVLSHPKTLGDDTLKHLKEQFNEIHKGVGNFGRTIIVEEGLSYSPMSMTSVDAQLLENRKFQVEEIARAFRVPMHMLQNTEGARLNGDAIEQQNRAYYDQTLMPYLERIELAFEKAFGMDGETEYIEFSTWRLIRADIATRFKVYAMGRQWGIFSVNDTLLMEGMDPIGPEGDNRMAPVNMMPLAEWMKGGWKNVGNPTSDPGMAVGGEGGANVPTGGEDA